MLQAGAVIRPFRWLSQGPRRCCAHTLSLSYASLSKRPVCRWRFYLMPHLCVACRGSLPSQDGLVWFNAFATSCMARIAASHHLCIPTSSLPTICFLVQIISRRSAGREEIWTDCCCTDFYSGFNMAQPETYLLHINVRCILARTASSLRIARIFPEHSVDFRFAFWERTNSCRSKPELSSSTGQLHSFHY